MSIVGGFFCSDESIRGMFKKKIVLNTLKCSGLHAVFKALEKEVSGINLVSKASSPRYNSLSGGS